MKKFNERFSMKSIRKHYRKKLVYIRSKMSMKYKKEAILFGYLPFDWSCSPYKYCPSMVYVHFKMEPVLNNAKVIPKFSNIHDENVHRRFPALVGYLKDFDIYENFTELIEGIEDNPLLEKQHHVRFLIEPLTDSGLYRYKSDTNLVKGKRFAVDLKHAFADYEMALIFTSVYNISRANESIFKVTMMLEGIIQETINLTTGLLTDKNFELEILRFTKEYMDTILYLIKDVTSIVYEELLLKLESENELEALISQTTKLNHLESYLIK